MGGRGVWEITVTDQEPNDAARRHEELAERALAERTRIHAEHERRARAIERRARLSVALVWVAGGGLIVVPPVVALAIAYPGPAQSVLVTALALTVGLPLGNWITAYGPGLARAAVRRVRGGGA